MKKRLINIIGFVLLLLSPVLTHAQATQINYQYWIDNNKDAAVSGTTTDGAALNLSIDVANLSSGIHILNMRAREGKKWGTVYRKLFSIPREQQASSDKLITGYRYGFDGSMTTVTFPSPVGEYTLTQAFDAPEPPLPTTIDDDCHFSFSGTTATLMRNVEMTFALTFTDESKAMSSPVGTTFTVTDMRTSDILSLDVPGSLTVPDHTTGGYTVMSFTIPSAEEYVLTSTAAAGLRLFSSEGATLTTVEAEALTAGYSQEYEAGTYYAVVYDNTDEMTLSVAPLVERPSVGYAILDTETGTLTFKYGVMPEGDNVWNTENTDFVDSSIQPWATKAPWISDNLTKVVFDPSYVEARPQSTAFWFNGASKLEDIIGLEYLNTSQVTTMDYMFGYILFTILDVSHFDTSNVTSMSGMFRACTNLTTLDVSHFDTSKVTDMSGLFWNCNSLTTLDVRNFDTSKVTNMKEMFYDCKGLTSLDVTHFDTSNVTMMNSMFEYCISLTSLDVSCFNTSNVTNLAAIFSDCSSLTSIDVSHFDTSKVKLMGGMFSSCNSLTTLDVRNFDTSNVISMYAMFAGCSGLTNLDVSNFDTSNVTDMGYMFSHCNGLTNLDLSNFDTSNVTEMDRMFWKCHGMESLDLSSFNTANVTTMNCMFLECSGLTSHDLSNFDTGNVTDMGEMFSGCNGLTSLGLSNFNTGNVTNMIRMFSGCSNLTTIYAGEGWSLESVTSDNGMFNGCSKLEGYMGTTYNPSFVDKTYARIDGGPDAPGYLSVKGYVPTVESVQFNQNNSILTLTTVTEGATIKYRVDNGEWTTYSNPLAMEGEYTIQAYATKQGYKDSDISSYAFVYHRPVVATPIITHDSDVITITTATEGATIHYTTDGTDPTAQSPVYSGPFTVTENGTIKSIAICEGYQDSEVSSLTVNWIIIGKTCGYAILDLNSKTLTFYYGIKPADNRTEEGIRIYEADNAEFYNFTCHNPWYTTEITTVIFDSSFAQARPSTTAGWFYDCSNLTNIIGIEYLNTEEVTDIAWMFYDCKKLTSIDLSHFNTSKVKDMSWMFSGCSNLESLDLSHFDTSKVKDMSWMFSLCYGLKSLNLMNFNTSSVTTMGGMFCGCNVISLDLSSFDTSEVQYMDNMFSGSSIKELDLSNFNTKNVITMDEMFRNCENLTTVYAGDDWIIRGQEFWMMAGCINIVGGLGTKYDHLKFCEEYARIDGGPSAPGYFTKGYVKGDANGDGVVTADDVKAVENYILGIESAKFFFLASDMNSDGEINAVDIVALINLIGNQQKK